MHKILALLACLLVGFVATGCGSDETTDSRPTAGAPALDDLLIDSVKKLQTQTGAAYEIDVKVDGKTAATGESPFPITASLSGVTGKGGITAKGAFSGAGEKANAELRLGLDSVFVNLNGTWFGSEQYGINDLKDRAESELSGTAPEVKPDEITIQEIEAAIRAYRRSVIDGPVKAAEIDGEDVWEADLKLNVDGIVALDERFEKDPAKRLSAKDVATLRKVAPLVRIRYAVGRDDGLPRRLAIDFTSDDLAAIDASLGAQVRSIDAHLTMTLSDYGTEAKIDRPSSFQPIEQLLSSLLGGITTSPS